MQRWRVRSVSFRWLRRFLGWSDEVRCVDLAGDSRFALVQLWECNGAIYNEGDKVPHLPNGHSTYCIRVDEYDEWYVNIAQGQVRGWSDKPIHDDVVDYRGNSMRTRHAKVTL